MTDYKKSEGSIKVSKKVLTEIAQSALEGMQGVQLASPSLWDKMKSAAGEGEVPGISVRTYENEEVGIHIKVQVAYGLNIPTVARGVQDVVKKAIEGVTELTIKDVSVEVQGIEKKVPMS